MVCMWHAAHVHWGAILECDKSANTVQTTGMVLYRLDTVQVWYCTVSYTSANIVQGTILYRYDTVQGTILYRYDTVILCRYDTVQVWYCSGSLQRRGPFHHHSIQVYTGHSALEHEKPSTLITSDCSTLDYYSTRHITLCNTPLT